MNSSTGEYGGPNDGQKFSLQYPSFQESVPRAKEPVAERDALISSMRTPLDRSSQPPHLGSESRGFLGHGFSDPSECSSLQPPNHVSGKRMLHSTEFIQNLSE